MPINNLFSHSLCGFFHGQKLKWTLLQCANGMPMPINNLLSNGQKLKWTLLQCDDLIALKH